MNITKIRDVARKLGIQPESLFKTELIRTIQNKEGNYPCYGTAYDGVCDRQECCWREECFEASRIEKRI
jgi:hypothetical protein